MGEGEPKSSALTAQPRPLASQVTSAFHLVERVRGGRGAAAQTLRGSAGLTASSCLPALLAPLRASLEPGAAVGQRAPLHRAAGLPLLTFGAGSFSVLKGTVLPGR